MWNETIALSIVNALTAVIEMLLAIVLMDSFFVFRFQKKAIKYITGFAAAGLLFAISLLPFGWSTPLEILLIALMLISMYKGNIRYKAIYCVVCALAVSLASILASMILSILPENLPLIDNSSMFFSMLRLILPKALLMIFIFCLSSLLKRKSWNFAPKYWILLLSVPLITLAIFTVFQYYIDALPPQARQISESIRILINGDEIIFPWLSIYGYIITAGIGLIFINILVFVLFSRLQKNADMKTRYEILTRQIEEQSASIEKLENSYTRMRQLRHDMQNQLLIVRSLLDNEKYDDLKSYVKTMINTVDEAAFMTISGQSAVDAILNEKLLAAHKNKIATRFEVDKLTDLFLPPMDLCIILANALDNAVEACVKIPENEDRYIHLKITANKDSLVLSCANPYQEPPKKRGNEYISSKHDKQNHGFGLKSIKATADKYAGEYLIRCQDHIFTLIVKINRVQTAG